MVMMQLKQSVRLLKASEIIATELAIVPIINFETKRIMLHTIPTVLLKKPAFFLVALSLLSL